MRCSSYCTAEEYTLNQETISILEKTTINPEFIEKVLHYQLTNEHDSHRIDVFLFTFGCIIIWGADEKKEEEILRNIGFVEKRKLKDFILVKTCFTAVSQITIVCGGIIERTERKHSSSNCE